MKKRHITIALALPALGLIPNVAHAERIIFSGNSPGDGSSWTDSNNWTGETSGTHPDLPPNNGTANLAWYDAQGTGSYNLNGAWDIASIGFDNYSGSNTFYGGLLTLESGGNSYVRASYNGGVQFLGGLQLNGSVALAVSADQGPGGENGGEFVSFFNYGFGGAITNGNTPGSLIFSGDGVVPMIMAGGTFQNQFNTATVATPSYNTYSGGTTIQSGLMILATGSALSGSVLTSGPIGTGALTLQGGHLDPGNASPTGNPTDRTISHETANTLYNVVFLSNSVDTASVVTPIVFGETGGAALTFAGAATITVASSVITVNSNTTFSGGIGQQSPGSSLTKNGAGTLHLLGPQTYTGPTNIQAGMLAGNFGLQGNLNITGSTLSIGDPTTASVAGSLSLDSSSVYVEDITSNVPGTGYDVLNVTGVGNSISLGNATLSINAGGYTPVLTDVIDLIQNQTGDPIQGQFAGLAQDAPVTINGETFHIFYNGGLSGQDVVLAVPEPSGMAVVGLSSFMLTMRARRRKKQQ